MKLVRISLITLFALFALFSCEKEHKESRGMDFDGLWLLDRTFVYDGSETPIDTITGRNFINIINDDAKFDDILEFYTNAKYDSSFFYTIRDNDIVCRKINDLQMVIDSWKNPNNPSEIIYDTTFTIAKPLKPSSDEVAETYFATHKFTETNLILSYYKQSPSSTDKPLKVSYYSRSKE